MPATTSAPTTLEPVLATVEPRPAAVVRLEDSVARLGEGIGLALGEVTTAVADAGLVPTGEPFTHYLAWGPEMVVAEVGIPIGGPITAHGRVVPGTVPGGTVAVALHEGPYDAIGRTYSLVASWIREQRQGSVERSWNVWQLLTFELWMQAFLDGTAGQPPEYPAAGAAAVRTRVT